MKEAEYENLQRVEGSHWYYSGKRRIVQGWIHRVRPPKASDTLLDCGAGTGIFAKEMEADCKVLVLDDHEESLRMLRKKFRADQLVELKNGSIDLPDASVEYVTALDVLEHIDPHAEAVKGFYRVLRPGGLAVVTVPASMALFSDWDVSLHHFRRYDRAGLCAIFPSSDWEIVHVNYTNVLVFPIVWLVRKARRKQIKTETAEVGTRAEDKMPSKPVNAVLKAIFAGMGLWRTPMPFGVSLVLVARKK